MGWYWAASDLVNYMPQPQLGINLITGSSYPLNLTEFDTVISMTEGEVHAAVAQGGYEFPVPTSASVAYTYIQKVVSDGAQAFAIERITPGATSAQDMKKAYDQALAAISSGKMTLLDAPSGAGLTMSGSPSVPDVAVDMAWEP